MEFNARMTTLVAEIVRRQPAFSRFDTARIGISAAYCRARRRSGLLAYVVPLKFRGGCPVERRVRGNRIFHWAMIPRFAGENELLYIIYFLLPRFWHLSQRQKLETVVHELCHINPLFDGDLRRFPGRSRWHGDRVVYEKNVARLTDEFLSTSPDPAYYSFLKEGAERCQAGMPFQALHLPEPQPRLLKVELLGAGDTIRGR